MVFQLRNTEFIFSKDEMENEGGFVVLWSVVSKWELIVAFI